MKRFLLIFVTITVASCSFDNKTGIWKDAANIPVENQSKELIDVNNSTPRYEDIFIKNKTFSEEKEPSNSFNVKIDSPVQIKNWFEKYTTPSNNISNFFYSDNKILLSSSPKLSRFSSNQNYSDRNIVFYKNNLISYDHKGTIFIYSLVSKKKIFEYNFYKKNFKNFEKVIYLIVNKNILYAADNLGYLYALNLDNNSIIWAKNYGIPFRSNIKFVNNRIFLANQDNVIYAIEPHTGDTDWQFATSLTFLKSDFLNNFAVNLISSNILFLNTTGELYSINYLTQKFNWVINFKNSSFVDGSDIFLSQPIVLKDNNLIITTENAILSYDLELSSRNWTLPAKAAFKPIITTNFTYVILKNNLLICINNINGEVEWSKNIFTNVQNKKTKKKFKMIVDFKIVNNQINIFSKSGYLLSFNSSDGKLSDQKKISKNGVNSEIFFVNKNMLFINNKNKLLKFN